MHKSKFWVTLTWLPNFVNRKKRLKRKMFKNNNLSEYVAKNSVSIKKKLSYIAHAHTKC